MPKPFLTPPDTPEGEECRSLKIPSSKEWLGIFNSALLETIYHWNYEQVNDTDLTPGEAAEKAREIVWAYFDAACGTGEVPAPVWEDDAEVDDEAGDDIQPWYGYVENPEAPPEELEFKTQVGIWVITGFLAFASFEVAFAPAIAFAAIAPKFALAWQRGDVGEVIKIFVKTVEGEYGEAATVDTSTWDEGDVRDITIIGGDEPEEREYLIMSQEAV